MEECIRQIEVKCQPWGFVYVCVCTVCNFYTLSKSSIVQSVLQIKLTSFFLVCVLVSRICS